MIAIKSINGNPPPIEPTVFNITRSDLYSDATGRSAETGKMLSYPIRLGMYTLDLEYHGYDTEIAAIEQLISGTSLNVVFLDNSTYVTKNMYPSDRIKNTEKIMNGKARYLLSFSLVER